MNTVGVKNPDLGEKRTWFERGLLSLLRHTLPPYRDNETAAEHLHRHVGKVNKHIEWWSVRPDSLINAEISPYDIKESPITGILTGRPTTRSNVAHFMTELAVWIRDVTHFVANALKHYYAKLALFQQFQSLCTRIRQRLQQTQFAFLLPPKARAKGRFLSVSRQAQWGVDTLAYLEAKEREPSPEATVLAQALRGLKSFKLFLMTLVRHTTCLNAACVWAPILTRRILSQNLLDDLLCRRLVLGLFPFLNEHRFRRKFCHFS